MAGRRPVALRPLCPSFRHRGRRILFRTASKPFVTAITRKHNLCPKAQKFKLMVGFNFPQAGVKTPIKYITYARTPVKVVSMQYAINSSNGKGK